MMIKEHKGLVRKTLNNDKNILQKNRKRKKLSRRLIEKNCDNKR